MKFRRFYSFFQNCEVRSISIVMVFNKFRYLRQARVWRIELLFVSDCYEISFTIMTRLKQAWSYVHTNNTFLTPLFYLITGCLIIKWCFWTKSWVFCRFNSRLRYIYFKGGRLTFCVTLVFIIDKTLSLMYSVF